MKAVEIGAFEAKTKFAELLSKVVRGQEFLITKRGKPVARLVGSDVRAAVRVGKPGAWELYQRIHQGGAKISRHQLKELIKENRRELLARTEKLLR
ncbi:MAG: type II toxin-antitoxin system prevent-host-death family antitoxin [Pedosphaera sp.]|nr:type II toxin-antitoxin system prevent-host-death family antitoxin [Pedosphaera sp.]